MACYRPLQGFYSKARNESGKRSIVFKPDLALTDMRVSVPCGQCMGCRLEKSRQWAMRIMAENDLHDESCFITLTYSPEHLPKDGSLRKKHFQDFMKRLRKKYHDKTIRYFHCGEYGEELGRPHYHCILFGLDFGDKVYYKTVNGNRLYISPTLEKIWGFGFSPIGNVDFESAAYVARYVTKKVTGPEAEHHYQRVDMETGEYYDVLPEYATMSRGRNGTGGIGKEWYDQFKKDLYPKDFVTMRGQRMKPPKYFDKLFEEEEPEVFKQIKASRLKQMAENKDDNTALRLYQKEKTRLGKIKPLERKYEK